MIYILSEEQQLLKDTARDFADNILAPVSGTIDKEEKIPAEIISKLAEMGFWSIMVPEKYGGAGLDTFSLMLVLEQISRACASTSVTLSVHNSLVCNAITKYGSEEQKQKYLPKLAAGEIIGAYSLTEPDAGSDAASIKTHAQLRGNNYIINGVKTFVTSGPTAGLIVLFARTDAKTVNGKGISAFLVEPGFKGVNRGKKEEKMGVRGAPMCEIALEDAVVPKENLMGKVNTGFNIAMDVLNCGRIGIAMQSVGIAQSALDMAIKYAKERKQFGKLLNEFQAVKWKIAETATEIEAARLLAYQAALMRDKGVPYAKEASMAKLFASGAVNRAVKESLQIHGGMGYTKDFAIERLFRDAKITEIYEGTSEIQHIVISKFLEA
ncbi:MAG: acyl-CoA dehydrogenase family protein [Planctomycetota bacterium]